MQFSYQITNHVSYFNIFNRLFMFSYQFLFYNCLIMHKYFHYQLRCLSFPKVIIAFSKILLQPDVEK